MSESQILTYLYMFKLKHIFQKSPEIKLIFEILIAKIFAFKPVFIVINVQLEVILYKMKNKKVRSKF